MLSETIIFHQFSHSLKFHFIADLFFILIIFKLVWLCFDFFSHYDPISFNKISFQNIIWIQGHHIGNNDDVIEDQDEGSLRG